jgi:hypothetical protein
MTVPLHVSDFSFLITHACVHGSSSTQTFPTLSVFLCLVPRSQEDSVAREYELTTQISRLTCELDSLRKEHAGVTD